MAVIEDIEGLEVQIVVDGVPLREYEEPPDTNDDDETKVTKYIVAEPGKEFVVVVKGTHRFIHGPPNTDACVYVRIDGKKAKGSLANRRYGSIGTKRIEGIDVDAGKGNWVRKCFMFSHLVFDNDANPATATKDQLNRTSALGEIEVEIVPGTIGRDLDVHNSYGNDFSAVDKVHEKSLKGRAISQKTGLSAPKPTNAPLVSEFTALPNGTCAKFIFKYRSERDLKAEMIIPRSPTPVPLEDRELDDLTPDQLRELLRRRRANDAVKPEGQRVKRERFPNNGENANEDDEDVEVVTPPPKKPRVIDTIDLTGD